MKVLEELYRILETRKIIDRIYIEEFEKRIPQYIILLGRELIIEEKETTTIFRYILKGEAVLSRITIENGKLKEEIKAFKKEVEDKKKMGKENKNILLERMGKEINDSILEDINFSINYKKKNTDIRIEKLVERIGKGKTEEEKDNLTSEIYMMIADTESIFFGAGRKYQEIINSIK